MLEDQVHDKGNINLKREVGEGTVFTIGLPVAKMMVP